MNKSKITGLIIVCAGFFLAMAIMDFTVMHLSNVCYSPYGAGGDWLYKYWISLGLVTGIFAFGLCYLAYISGLSKRYLPAIFLTAMLLFVAGLLDIFYYVLTLIKGESYGFSVWSAQHKILVVSGILPEWNWTCQILWSSFFFAIIGVIWYYTLKKHK
jgi:hypothetical protein